MTGWAGSMRFKARPILGTEPPTERLIAPKMRQIVRLMTQIAERKPSIELMADWLMNFYGPVVFAVAALAFVGWLLFTGDVLQATVVLLTTIIMGYPCALGITTPMLAAIAAKGAKELAYHRDYAAQWVVRLGDGTPVSHERMQAAFARTWPLVDELFQQPPGEGERGAQGQHRAGADPQRIRRVGRRRRRRPGGRWWRGRRPPVGDHDPAIGGRARWVSW